jgi:hypothetical protein
VFVERQPLLALPQRFERIGSGVNPPAVVAHVVATFGMFFEQSFFDVHENDVGLDLGVVVVGGLQQRQVPATLTYL